MRYVKNFADFLAEMKLLMIDISVPSPDRSGYPAGRGGGEGRAAPVTAE